MKTILALGMASLLISCGENEQARKDRETKERDARIDRILSDQREKERVAQTAAVEYWKNVALTKQADARAEKAELRAMVAEMNAAPDNSAVLDAVEDVAADSRRQHAEQMNAIEDVRQEAEDAAEARRLDSYRKRLR